MRNVSIIQSEKELSDFLRVINPNFFSNKKAFVPRSGLYFIDIMKDLDILGKNILDIGTGYSSFIAVQALLLGARQVVAVDIDIKIINFLRDSFYKNKIDFILSDVYNNVSEDKKFDFIFSNPPQLPSIMGGNLHDVAGADGLEVIRKIIFGFPNRSSLCGSLILLVFDFLLESVIELCKSSNLFVEVKWFFEKEIRKGGETEKRMDYIKSIYVGYKLDPNKNYHKVFIIEVSKYESNHKSRSCN